MNCKPRLVVNNIAGQLEFHLICETHGFVSSGSSRAYCGEEMQQGIVFMISDWGKHVLEEEHAKRRIISIRKRFETDLPVELL